MEFEPSVESQVRTYTQGSGEGGALESEERNSLQTGVKVKKCLNKIPCI